MHVPVYICGAVRRACTSCVYVVKDSRLLALSPLLLTRVYLHSLCAYLHAWTWFLVMERITGCWCADGYAVDTVRGDWTGDAARKCAEWVRGFTLGIVFTHVLCLLL